MGYNFFPTTQSKSLLFIVPLVACLPWFIDHIFRRQYPVHASGSVLISGASTGIGRHLAISLGEAGFNVFAGVRTDEAAKDLNEFPGVRALFLDITDPDSIAAAHDTVVAATADGAPPMVGLVNNAGIAQISRLEKHSMDDIRKMFEVNVFGHLMVTQMFLPILKESFGRIVFTSSIAGRGTSPELGVYSATKHAIEAIGNSLRIELNEFDVAISLIEPGFVETALLKKIGFSHLVQQEEEQRKIEAPNPTMKGRYRALIETATRMASPPDVTTKAIMHALQSPNPKSRYLVANAYGIPVWLVALAFDITPTWLVDWCFTTWVYT